MATTKVKQPVDELDALTKQIADKKSSEALDVSSAKRFIPTMEDKIAALEEKVGGLFLHDNVTYKFPKDKVEKLKMQIINGDLPDKRLQLFEGAIFLVDRDVAFDTNPELELAKQGIKEGTPYSDVTGRDMTRPLTEEEMKMTPTV